MKKSIRGICYLLCFLAYTSIYVARLNLSMASAALTTGEGAVMTVAEFGLLGSVFSVVYAVGRLCNGILNDRVLPAVMLGTGLLASGAANLTFSFFPPALVLAILWAVNAYGQSMLWGSVLRLIKGLYDDPVTAQKRSAVMVSTVAVGNILGILLNTRLITDFGVKWAFLIPGLWNVLLAVPIFIVERRVPFSPAEAGKVTDSLKLLALPRVRRMVVPAMLHGVMKDNISLWMAGYFVATFATDIAASSWFLLLIPAVGLVGRLAYTGASALCKNNEKTVMVLGFVLCLLASIGLAVLPTYKDAAPLGIVALAAILLSVVYAAVSLINTGLLTIFPMRFGGNTAAVSGVMDFSTYLGAAIGSAVYGVAIAKAGYSFMFLSWIVLSLAAAVYVWVLKKRGNKG